MSGGKKLVKVLSIIFGIILAISIFTGIICAIVAVGIGIERIVLKLSLIHISEPTRPY